MISSAQLGRNKKGSAMTTQDFRRIALGLPEAVESSHMKHPDFRVRDKIFATLGYPDAKWGMVKLTPDEQASFVRSDPAAFMPVKGAWGRRGAPACASRPPAKRRYGMRSPWPGTTSHRSDCVKIAVRHK